MPQQDKRFAMIGWVTDQNDGVRQSWEGQLVRNINYIKGFEPWGKVLLLIKSVNGGSRDYGAETFAKSHGMPENAQVLASASLDDLLSTISVIGWIKSKINGLPAPQKWIDIDDNQALVGQGVQATETISPVEPPQGGDWLTTYILRAKYALMLAENLKQRLSQQISDPTQQEFSGIAQALYETSFISRTLNLDTDHQEWAQIKQFVDNWYGAMVQGTQAYTSAAAATHVVKLIKKLTG
jgi:hypothetical protein